MPIQIAIGIFRLGTSRDKANVAIVYRLIYVRDDARRSPAGRASCPHAFVDASARCPMRMTRAELRRIRAATDITGEMHPVADRLMLVAWSLSVGLAQGYRLHLLHDCSRCADQPSA